MKKNLINEESGLGQYLLLKNGPFFNFLENFSKIYLQVWNTVTTNFLIFYPVRPTCVFEEINNFIPNNKATYSNFTPCTPKLRKNNRKNKSSLTKCS